MAEDEKSERLAPLADLYADNPWFWTVLGGVGVVATFATAGLVPTLILIAVLVVFVMIALARSWRKAVRRADGLAAALAERDTADEDDVISDVGDTHRERRHLAAASAEAEPPDEESTEDGEPNAQDDSDGPMWEALTTAVEDRNVGVARQLLDQYIDTAKDESVRIERQAFALRVRGWAGDSTALTELEDLLKAHRTDPAPALALAHTLEGLKEYERASDILQQAAGTVENSAHVLAEASRLNRIIRDFIEAQALAEQALVNATKPTEEAEAHRALGWTLWEMGRRQSAFTHWESALHLSPADDDLRFAVAYRYSETGIPELALLHYEVLVSSDVSYGSAQNNLGVVLDRLGMDFAAAGNYRAAAERGESLPASNLASKFLTAGCGDEVEQWLAKGREATEVNARVAQVEGEFASAREEEDKTRAATRQRADELRRLYSEGLLPTDVPTGRWTVDGEEIQLEPEGDDASIQPAQWGHRYRFVRSTAGLEVTYRSSHHASSQSGLGCLRDGVLRFYLKSLTLGEASKVVTGQPVPDGSPD